MKPTEIKALIGAGALSLAFLGGVAFAPAVVSGVLAQTGPTTDQTTDQRGPGQGDPFTIAANYIGITVDQLRSEMGTTKSMADVAIAHGKTRDGLIAALVTAETANIQQRISGLVDHKGAPQKGPAGPRGGAPGGPAFGFGQDLQTASTYLGISQSDLITQLRSGKTLAQIAAATPGKSRDGLIAALVQAATAKIDQAVKDGKLTADQATKIKADLATHIANMVDGKFPPMGPRFGPGGPRQPGGPNAPRPSPSATPGA